MKAAGPSLTARTFGGLNVGDIGRKARLSDNGFAVNGEIEWVWHSATYKGEPQTAVRLKLTDGEIKVTRPPHTEIFVEAAR